MDPVKLYKKGSEKLIASVDVAGWLADGWATQPTDPVEPETKIEAVSDEPVEVETEAVEVKTIVKRK